MPIVNQQVPPVSKPPRRRISSVRGPDIVHGFAEHRITAVFTDPEGAWAERPAVVNLGPNGGEYARISVTDHDLETFALGILSALHDKRKEQQGESSS